MKNIKLSENFRLYESRCRGDEEDKPCCCHGAVAFVPEELVIILQRYRTEYFKAPMRITSWFRCDEYNKAVRGHSGSYHRLGKAADFTGERMWAVDEDHFERHAHALNGIVDEVIGTRSGNIFYYPERKFIHLDVGRMTVDEPSSEARVRRKS